MVKRRRLRLQSLEDRQLLAADFPGAVDLSALQLDTSTYDTSSILVKFADDRHVSSSTGAQIMPGTTVGESIVPGIFRVELSDTADYQSVLAEYLNDPAVIFAQPDYRVYIQQTPNDPELGNMWPLENDGAQGGTDDADIDAARAWDQHTGSGNLVVAVIDTGVDYTHPDLASNMWVNPGEGNVADGIDNDGNGYVDDIHGFDFVNDNGDPFDDHGHGTHVAGTIGAVGDNGIGVTGINWDVQIMALKFLDSSGQGSTSDAIEAIYYAANHGAKISNNSWGGDPFSSALLQAITDAGDAGHIFVTAAGNGNEFGIGQDNDQTPFFPSNHDLSNLVSVAASDNRDALAVFSNYGAGSVDLTAPGVDILSTLPGGTYGYNSGTSMATPHVAGVLSLVWDFNPDWSLDQVIDQVLSTVDPIPWLNGIVSTGGRLNAAAALGNPEAPPPAPVPGTLPSADSFDDGSADSFLIQAGFWEVSDGRYEATRVVDNDDIPAISTLNVNSLPDDLLLEATVNSVEGRTEFFGILLGDEPTNGFLVFDYQDISHFKFAGANMDDGRWVIGHRSDSGWHNDAVVSASLQGDTDYHLQLLLGSDRSATLRVDGNTLLTHTFDEVLTDGDVGLGMRNATTSFDHFLAIDVNNEGPQLEPLADQVLTPGESRTINISASDPDGDPIFYSVAMPGVVDRPSELDQQLNLRFGGNYWENWYGLGEKWIAGDAGWFWILPNGSFYQDAGSVANSTLVEVLDPIYHQDPTLLHDAQAPTPPISFVINGSQLTMTAELTSAGTFDVVLTASDGFHQTSQTFKIDVVNTAPVIDSQPDQQISPGDSRTITLSATDLEGQSISYLARIEEVDNRAFQLDQSLGLGAGGSAWQNWYGLGEKWIQGESGWYWITPDGAFYADGGNVAASILIDMLDPIYYAQPELLYDAQPSGTLSLDGTELTIGTNANFQGTFNVIVTASDGILTDSSMFVVQVINQAPVISPIPDQDLSSGERVTVSLSVSDPENDAVTLFAEALTANNFAFELDQALNLRSVGDLWNNWYGLGEKWMQGDSGWYWIGPDGSFYKDGGSATSSTLVATLDPIHHQDPSLLYEAQPTLPPATLTLIGNQLTIDLAPGQSGTIDIRVTAVDEFNEVSQTFVVNVLNSMPTLAGIADQEVASGSSQNLTLSASDLDGDPITFSARIEGLEDSSYELDQQLGLRFSGSYWENYYGLGEKWMLGDDGYYWITPDGSVYKDGGSAAASTLVTVLNPIYHENPALLHEAQPLASVTIDGDQLTITTSPELEGTFQIVVSVSDGIHVVDQTFTVNVSP